MLLKFIFSFPSYQHGMQLDSFVKLLLKIYYIPSHRSITKPCPTLWTHGHQAPLSSTISWNLHKFMPTELVMLSNLLILCHLLLLLPSVFPSIRVFSNESVLHIRWPKYWSFNFSISPSNEYSELISFRIDLFDLLPCSPRDSQESSRAPQFESISSLVLRLLYGPSLTSIGFYGKTIAFSPWLNEPLSAKWCLCFLKCCLGFS